MSFLSKRQYGGLAIGVEGVAIEVDARLRWHQLDGLRLLCEAGSLQAIHHKRSLGVNIGVDLMRRQAGARGKLKALVEAGGGQPQRLPGAGLDRSRPESNVVPLGKR